MTQEQFRRNLLSPFKLRLFLWSKLPLAAIAGLKVLNFDKNSTEVGIKLGYLTKNPFGSIYFAAMAMAAELSTGAIAFYHSQFREKRCSMLVTKLEAEYFKKAKGKISFHCKIDDENNDWLSIEDLTEGTEKLIESIGKDESGEVVALFKFYWSFKFKTEK